MSLGQARKTSIATGNFGPLGLDASRTTKSKQKKNLSIEVHLSFTGGAAGYRAPVQKVTCYPSTGIVRLNTGQLLITNKINRSGDLNILTKRTRSSASSEPDNITPTWSYLASESRWQKFKLN